MIKSSYTTALAAGLVSVLSIGAALPSSAQDGSARLPAHGSDCHEGGQAAGGPGCLNHCVRVYEPRIKTPMPDHSVSDTVSRIEPALIRIIKDGTIYWGKDNSLMIDNDMNNHNLATLVQQLEAKKQEASAVGTKPAVQLWVEREVSHQRVVDVLNALTKAGITTVALTDLRDD